MPSRANKWRQPPSGALAEMLAADAEREDRPFGSFAGERLSRPGAAARRKTGPRFLSSTHVVNG